MTEQINPGEMPEQKQEPAQPVVANAAEMVSISAAELAEIRAALKKANGEAAKYRKTADQFEADQKAKAEAEMTELQKAQARAKELEEKLQQVERARLQSDIAAKVGLPAALASRLRGETPEELEADAKAVLELLPKPTKPAPGFSASNPGENGKMEETREQKKARLMGKSPDIWAGGGVIWGEQTPKE